MQNMSRMVQGLDMAAQGDTSFLQTAIEGVDSGAGASTEFDDDASIPEGATVEDETGKRFRKQNGQLVPVTRF